MRFVIHVGPHKTGTSYIQWRLSRAQTDLDSLGWVYPDAGTSGRAGQHDIAHHPQEFLAPEGAHTKEFLGVVQECRDNGKNLLLSAEGFRTWDAEGMIRLADFVGVEKAELVYAVRCPFSTFYSYWAEEVKQGFSGSLPFRFMQNFVDPENSRLLNPFCDLKRFEDNDRFEINIIYYDAARKRGLDICDLLTDQILGCGVLPQLHNTNINESYPIELTEFLRLITFRHNGTKRFTDSSFRLAFTRNTTADERHEIATTIAQKAASSFSYVQLPRDVPFYAGLKAQFAAKNYRRKLPAGGERDLPTTPCVWRFADLGMMMLVPEVVALVEKYERRIKEAGF